MSVRGARNLYDLATRDSVHDNDMLIERDNEVGRFKRPRGDHSSLSPTGKKRRKVLMISGVQGTDGDFSVVRPIGLFR